MSIEVNDGGVWRYIKAVQINDNGTWRTTRNVQINDNGSWRSPWILNNAVTIGTTGLLIGYLSSQTANPQGTSFPTETDINGYIFDFYYDPNAPGTTVFHLYCPQDTFTQTDYALAIQRVGITQLLFANANFWSSGTTFTTWSWNVGDHFGLQAALGTTIQIHANA